MTIIDNIVQLRATTGILGQIVYVKCHTLPDDCGGGHFVWKTLPTGNIHLNDNDGTFIRNNSNPVGWVRIIKDVINLSFFGIKNPGVDAGVIIQKAIDFAALNSLDPLVSGSITFRDYTACGSQIFIPAGTYIIADKIVIKRGVTISGDGIYSTTLKADNTTKIDGSMVEMDSGPVIDFHISNIFFDGNATVAQTTIIKHCMYFDAHPNSPVYGDTAGLWNSTFKNIRIRNFNGSGIILQGSGFSSQEHAVDYSKPNQDLIFENVNIARQVDASNCLQVKGMAGQLTFINCGFDGSYLPDGSGYKASKFFNVVLETKAVELSVVKFITCTFQYSEYGAFIGYGESVTFDNCWFELLDIAVHATKPTGSGNTSQCVNVINSRFANASGFGSYWNSVTSRNPTGGTCVSVEGGSGVNVQNNFVTVSNINNVNSNDYFVRNYGTDSKINILNNSFETPPIGKTLGVTNKTISIAVNTLTTFGYKFISVNCLPTNNTTNYIKDIYADIAPGELVTIRAVGTGQIKFDNSRNIVFSKATTNSSNPFILNAKETATFIKLDIPVTTGGTTYNETYHLICFNKSY